MSEISFGEDQDDKDLRCPCCFFYFSEDTKPYFLQCSHNVCLQCIKSMIQNNKTICPKCNSPFYDTDLNKFEVNQAFLNLVINILKKKTIYCKKCKKVFLWENHHQQCEEKNFEGVNYIIAEIQKDYEDSKNIIKNYEHYLSINQSTQKGVEKIIKDKNKNLNDFFQNKFNEEMKKLSNRIIKVNLKNYKSEIIKYLHLVQNNSKYFPDIKKYEICQIIAGNDDRNIFYKRNEEKNLRYISNNFDAKERKIQKSSRNFSLGSNKNEREFNNHPKIIKQHRLIKRRENGEDKLKLRIENIREEQNEDENQIESIKSSSSNSSFVIPNENENKEKMKINSLFDSKMKSHSNLKAEKNPFIKDQKENKINNISPDIKVDDPLLFINTKENNDLSNELNFNIFDIVDDEKILEEKNKSKLIVSNKGTRIVSKLNENMNDNSDDEELDDDDDDEIIPYDDSSDEEEDNNNILVNSNKNLPYMSSNIFPLQSLNQKDIKGNSSRNGNNAMVKSVNIKVSNIQNKFFKCNYENNPLKHFSKNKEEEKQIERKNQNEGKEEFEKAKITIINKFTSNFNRIQDIIRKIKLYKKEVSLYSSEFLSQIVDNFSQLKNNIIANSNSVLEEFKELFMNGRREHLISYIENTKYIRIIDIKEMTINVKSFGETLSSFPVFNNSLSIAFDDKDLIFISGGKDIPNENTTKFFLILSWNSSKIIENKQLPSPRANHSSLYHKGFLYIIGGMESENTLIRKCLRYNVFKKRFEELPSLNNSRQNPTLCLYNEKIIYVFRGFNKIKELLSIEFLNIKKIEAGWEQFTPEDPGYCWCGGIFSGAVTLGKNQILIFGGSSNGEVKNHCFLFQPEEKTVLKMGGIKLTSMFYGGSYEPYRNSIYAIEKERNEGDLEGKIGIHIFNEKNFMWEFTYK